jgi:hypothetical protein
MADGELSAEQLEAIRTRAETMQAVLGAVRTRRWQAVGAWGLDAVESPTWGEFHVERCAQEAIHDVPRLLAALEAAERERDALYDIVERFANEDTYRREDEGSVAYMADLQERARALLGIVSP